MQTAFISYKSSQIHYSYCGSGEKVVVCLHGYGESEKSFRFLETWLPAGYRLLAIDMPFHGETQWKDGLDFTPDDLLAVIDHCCQQQAVQNVRFTFMGFSMGGRMALSLLQSVPAKTDRLLLLAPDGLTVNFWYRLATRTSIGNRLFRTTMRHPNWFMWLLKAGNKLGIINQSIYKFCQYYIHDQQVREALYNRWTCMRHFIPQLSVIKRLIVQYDIPVHLLYGRHDRIIRHERGEKFSRGIESLCTLQVVPMGHQVLQERNAALIIELLQL